MFAISGETILKILALGPNQRLVPELDNKKMPVQKYGNI